MLLNFIVKRAIGGNEEISNKRSNKLKRLAFKRLRIAKKENHKEARVDTKQYAEAHAPFVWHLVKTLADSL